MLQHFLHCQVIQHRQSSSEIIAIRLVDKSKSTDVSMNVVALASSHLWWHSRCFPFYFSLARSPRKNDTCIVNGRKPKRKFALYRNDRCHETHSTQKKRKTKIERNLNFPSTMILSIISNANTLSQYDSYHGKEIKDTDLFASQISKRLDFILFSRIHYLVLHLTLTHPHFVWSFA